MPLPVDRTPVLKKALAAWDALNPGDPLEDIETAATNLAEAARVLIATPLLENALDSWSTLTSDVPVDVIQRSSARLKEADDAFSPLGRSPFVSTRPVLELKEPMLLAREAMDRVYGLGTDWEEPNEHGEEGFTRAQAETDIDADHILPIIADAIVADRAQHRRAAHGVATATAEGVSE